MVFFSATMRHSEASFQSLAHMQYDLFCRSNLIGRTAVSFGLMVIGIMNYTQWWGLLLIAYASYLLSSKYASANHTAQKLAKGIRDAGMDFPVSRFEFQENAVNIIALPENVSSGEPLAYTDILRLGEDGKYFYLFRDQYGGYMIPKEELGKSADDFRAFMEKKTGKSFSIQAAPVVKLLRRMDVRSRQGRRKP